MRAELAVAVASGEQVVRVGLVELVGQVAQEARVELVAQVAQEARAELVAQVVVELGLSRVEGLEHVRAEAVPGRDPVAVLLRTRSVIAAHPHGLAHRVVEDSAGAAETTREPAVTEAAVAWAAAVIAVVVAVVVVAAE